MKYSSKQKCQFCGKDIDFYYVIHTKQTTMETWITSENEKRADVINEGNYMKVVVRCPNSKCNKDNSFLIDSNNIIKE